MDDDEILWMIPTVDIELRFEDPIQLTTDDLRLSPYLISLLDSGVRRFHVFFPETYERIYLEFTVWTRRFFFIKMAADVLLVRRRPYRLYMIQQDINIFERLIQSHYDVCTSIYVNRPGVTNTVWYK